MTYLRTGNFLTKFIRKYDEQMKQEQQVLLDSFKSKQMSTAQHGYATLYFIEEDEQFAQMLEAELRFD